MQRLKIDLLGEARFTFDGKPWRFSAPPKCLPLLALLALRGERVARATLASQLWPDDTAADARTKLRRHLHALVRSLPKLDGVEWLEVDTATAGLAADAPLEVDAVTFLRCADDPSAFEAAVKSYKGELLATIFEEAIIADRERLRALYLQMLAELTHGALQTRAYARALEYAESMLAQDEWREDALRTTMIARYRLGDRSGALAAFERFARRLQHELRAEPMFESTAVRDAIVADSLPDTYEAPAVRTASPRPLIGRANELATLTHAWLQAARGKGTCVFISGEAGAGKTRLAHELLSSVEEQGGRAIIGRTSQPESVPYQPLVEAVRHLVPFIARTPSDDVWLATLASLVPDIARLHADLPEMAPLEQQRGQLRLQDAVLRALAASARQRPLAILLDDLHWAQSATIDIIGAVAERVASMPVLIVIAHRTGEAGAEPPVRALRRKLARSSNAAHIALGRLAARDVESLLEQQGVAEGATRARIAEISEGNPLFVWQLYDHYLEAGAIDERVAMQTVGEAIARRLESLEADSRTVAEIAATIGDTFSVEEIAEVAGWDEARVFAALAPLFDRRLIAERAGEAFEYGFTHAMIAAAIYEASPPQSRQARHRRAASVLARTRGERGVAHPLIAGHWLRVGEHALARASFLEAARSALRNYAHSEAFAFAGQVIGLEPPQRERFDALKIRVEATLPTEPDALERAIDDLETAAATLDHEALYEALVARIGFCERVAKRAQQEAGIERLAALAEEHGRAEWHIEARLRRATLLIFRGDMIECEAQLRLIPIDTSAIAPGQLTRLWSMLARSLARQGRYDEARAVMGEFRTWLDGHPSLEGEIFYWFAELRMAWVVEDANTVLRAATRMVGIAQQRGDLLQEATARMDMAWAKHQMHDTAGARIEFETALEYLARGHQWQGWLHARINYGCVENEIGHTDRAERYWQEAVERTSGSETRDALSVVDVCRWENAFVRGELERAAELARSAYERIAASGGRELAEASMSLGTTEIALGAVAHGLALFEAGANIARAMKTNRMLGNHLAHCLDALLRTGSTEHIDALAGELTGIFEADPHDQQYPGRVCWVLASIARMKGDAAAEHAWVTRGRELAWERLEAFTDEADRRAFSSIPHNARLFAWEPAPA